MAAVVSTQGLTKDYGEGRGVFDLDLEVRSGEIFGYLGPNGAGKTTTIRLLLDFIRPTRGGAELFGLDVRARNVDLKRRIGYLPGELSLYEKLTARELLTYFANLRGGVERREIESLSDRFELDLDHRIRELSTGNRQKVGLVQAFMHRPELLVLDEPTAGLDPLMRNEFHSLVREVAAEGRSVFVSSHVLAEVERGADRVGIIRRGRLVVVETIDILKAKTLRKIEVQFARPVTQDAFRELPGIRQLEFEDRRAQFEVGGSVDALIKTLAQFEVVSLRSHEPDLEEIFLTYYEEERPAA